MKKQQINCGYRPMENQRLTFEQVLPFRKLLPYRRYKWPEAAYFSMYCVLKDLNIVSNTGEYEELKDRHDILVYKYDENRWIYVDNFGYLKNCKIPSDNGFQFLVLMRVDGKTILLHFDDYKWCPHCERHYWEKDDNGWTH